MDDLNLLPSYVHTVPAWCSQHPAHCSTSTSTNSATLRFPSVAFTVVVTRLVFVMALPEVLSVLVNTVLCTVHPPSPSGAFQFDGSSLLCKTVEVVVRAYSTPFVRPLMSWSSWLILVQCFALLLLAYRLPYRRVSYPALLLRPFI